MLILVVQVHVGPGKREQFLNVIKDDAVHSEHDEPGCARFDVLQDTEDPDTFFYYEVYRDEAAVAAHRETPHYKKYAAAVATLTDRPNIRHLVRNFHPADDAWR